MVFEGRKADSRQTTTSLEHQQCSTAARPPPPQVIPVPFPRCCQFPVPGSLTAASHCSLMSPHPLCTWSSLPAPNTLPSCPIYGRGKAARNPGTKHCWIQHIGKKNLTLGSTWPLLQSVVTLPADFSATGSVFLLGSCNIPQCSQRRVAGENRQVSVLQ